METHLNELITFLKDPENFPDPVKKLSIIQTHASVLAIASPNVFKFKKPFDFGFMDFRSLEARKENCEKELVLNRRLSEDIYLKVLPLYRHNDQLTFDKKGEVTDFALQMKELENGYFLHQYLKEDKLDTGLLEIVLQVLKKFYEAQPAKSEINQFADLQHLQQNAEENFKSLRDLHEIIDPLSLEIIEQENRNFLQNNQTLFGKRIDQNKIKDCHGDLHLEHIHIRNNKVNIFDCIEFNDRFRYSDIAADIAFLAMDLDFNNRPAFGKLVAERMADILDDPGMLLLMDYYKCYRACVRAKVDGIRSIQEEISHDEQKESKTKALKYIQLALRYSLIGSRPFLFICCGRIGSGKSTIATQLEDHLGIPYHSSDVIRKESEGTDPFHPSEESEKEKLYGEKKTEEVYTQLLNKAVSHLQNQSAVVVDATFSKEKHRQLFAKKMQELQIAYCFIETDASDDIIKARLKERDNKTVISDARLDDFEKLSKAYSPVSEISTEHHIRINTEFPLEENMKKLLSDLARRKNKDNFVS